MDLVMEDVGMFMAIRFILRPIRKFYGHLVHFVVIWYIFSRFGILYQENSANPGYIHSPKDIKQILCHTAMSDVV
jgi:hypothetical protein